MVGHTPGAHSGVTGVDYCVWAPEAGNVEVCIESRRHPTTRLIALAPMADGHHHAKDPDGAPGDAYRFRVDGGNWLPDPASRAQVDDVHGHSMVVDPASFAWTDSSWRRPRFRDLVIYELHIGSFSRGGTFLDAIPHLEHLKALGITAIELMPIADFPGTRNWGYDGVLIYAPARAYGRPDDLRALVDAAHSLGIAVILDVVYNHLGPDGNYLASYHPGYFHKGHHTPWGDGFNLDGPDCGPVRRFFRENPGYWMDEFHVDGFRFDATHEIRDDSRIHILEEIAEAVHAKGGYAIAEDPRNLARIITEHPHGWGFDAVWADDFHHTVRVAFTRESHSYFAGFKGTLAEIFETVLNGWYYSGQHLPPSGKLRGTEGGHLPPDRFVHCISNHDQTGNCAFGERLHELIPAAAYRSVSALLCLSPHTPLLFMGQEWGATSPFLYFTDHAKDLGRKVTEGRRKEFAEFPEFSDPESRQRIPDPQALETFAISRLDWEELTSSEHRQILDLYRACLALRNSDTAFRPETRAGWSLEKCGPSTMLLTLENGFGVIFHLWGGGQMQLPDGGAYSFLLSSEDEAFGGHRRRAGPMPETISFSGPETFVFRRR